MIPIEKDKNKPLSYNDWASYQSNLSHETSDNEYLFYLKKWYFEKSKEKDAIKKTIKNDYIQLLKDLSFLFGKDEYDTFLKGLDFDNDEELIYTIPFFAKKLKQIAIIFSKKRESLKQAKLKYNLIGSNTGLEKIIYEYVLKGFTKTENNITQVPTLALVNLFPELSSVKDNFYVEIEELHDKNVYLGSDSTIPPEEYVNLNSINEGIISKEFESLSDNDFLKLFSSGFLSRISNSFLSNAFLEFLNVELPTLSTENLFNQRVLNVYNQIEAAKKYSGESLYGLTAIKLKDTNIFDQELNIDIQQGNNWFYWPSGVRSLDDTTFNNIYFEIPINESNFLASGATAGDDYTNSDLIFTDKNGIVEGAWLQGVYNSTPQKNKMTTKITGGENKEFIFPYPGINFSSKNLNFISYEINDSNNFLLDTINPKIKQKIVKDYFSGILPTSGVNSVYLNNTSLIENGAKADIFSDTADNILIKTRTTQSDALYSENNDSEIEQSYLYKFNFTDIPINNGLTQIYWPLKKIEDDENLPLTVDNKCCLPVYLKDINVSKTMVGCIAGFDFVSSDVILKNNSREGDTIEAAWLGSAGTDLLDILKNSIQIYDIPATRCAQYINGPIQSSLSLQVKSGEKKSFIWMDEDTYADDVIKFIEHSPSCPYLKTFPHDYYSDQDYQNKTPINDLKHWKKCNCKSLQYSPIGHSGEKITDFNGMADLLFADPDGMGEDFAINSWLDTRGLDPYHSPQFAYYKISTFENKADQNVGWGVGEWKTGNGSKMVLKTGRRYTYYRTNLRSSEYDSPYIITKYPYKNITGKMEEIDGFDLVIIIDNSKSQSANIDITKQAVNSIIDKLFSSKNAKNNIQIGIVSFNTAASKISYLTKESEALKLFVSQINSPTNPDYYNSNFLSSIKLADTILNEFIDETGNIIKNKSISNLNFENLCSKLNYTIFNTAKGTPLSNSPQNKQKKILIFSDGVENTINLDSVLGVLNPEELFSYDEDFKSYINNLKEEKNTQVYSVDIGKLSKNSDLMEQISSTFSMYFNLENYLVNGDGDLNSFIEYISNRIYGKLSIFPFWYKAKRDVNGNWNASYDKYGNLEISDMILRPGDYLTYIHRSNVFYSGYDNVLTNFSVDGTSFSINTKLNGWDYENNKFSEKNIGDNFGARPFWAVVETGENIDKNFRKDTMSFGGKIKFVNDYLPIQQPDVSTTYLSFGDIIEYKRKSTKDFIWDQSITLTEIQTKNQWNELIFKKDFSNLKDFLYKEKFDGVLTASNNKSNLILEGYNAFKPAFFNYYARNPFSYSQILNNKNRCLETYVIYNTGVLIQPSSPSENILNNFTPGFASVPLPYNIISEKETGYYLLPENLGVSFYRGKGYTISIDNTKIESFKSLSAESIYFDLNKYGPRQRGLTKNDQLTISKIENIENSWMIEPYSSGSKSGMIVNTVENQKLTPYQTTYEIKGKNDFGLALQNDVFQFWTPPIPPTWNNEEKFPLSFRKELLEESFSNRKDKLLINKGKLNNWRVDIFGNNYGLYKQKQPNDINGLILWFSADRGVVKTNAPNIFSYDQYAADGDSIVRWADQTKRKNDLVRYFGRPTLKLNSDNGKSSILFDDTEGLDVIKNNYILDVNEISVYVVGKFNKEYVDQTQSLISFGEKQTVSIATDYEFPSLAISNKENGINFEFGNTATQERITLSNESEFIDPLKFHVFEMYYHSNNCFSLIDKKPFADTLNSSIKLENGIYSTRGMWLGSYTFGTLATSCEISEIIIFKRKLNVREIDLMYRYLFSKYSII